MVEERPLPEPLLNPRRAIERSQEPIRGFAVITARPAPPRDRWSGGFWVLHDLSFGQSRLGHVLHRAGPVRGG